MPTCLALRIIRLVAFAPAVIAPCAGSALAGGPPAQVLSEINELIGDAACSADTQCRTLAIGNRACGGPDAYLAWSTQKTDATTLQRAAERYNRQPLTGPTAGGRTSICTVVTDPGAVCRPAAVSAVDGGISKSCQLRPRAAAPAQTSR